MLDLAKKEVPSCLSTGWEHKKEQSKKTLHVVQLLFWGYVVKVDSLNHISNWPEAEGEGLDNCDLIFAFVSNILWFTNSYMWGTDLIVFGVLTNWCTNFWQVLVRVKNGKAQVRVWKEFSHKKSISESLCGIKVEGIAGLPFILLLFSTHTRCDNNYYG